MRIIKYHCILAKVKPARVSFNGLKLIAQQNRTSDKILFYSSGYILYHIYLIISIVVKTFVWYIIKNWRLPIFNYTDHSFDIVVF